jgi:hypothetical protein
VHYFDAHLPYSPPSGYDRFFDPGYRGAIGGSFGPDRLAPNRGALLAEMRTWSAADWDRVRSLYDGEIRFTDDAIGTLVRGLDARGLKHNTLIVFLSDHGQEFFEHGAYGHGHSLYGEVLRVPLVVSLAGRLPQGVRVREQVRLVDVVPTVLDILGYEELPDLEGVSLLPLASGDTLRAPPEGKVLPPQAAFAEGVRLGGELKALTTASIKTIHDVTSGRTLAFDLVEDPAEQRPVEESEASYPRDAARALLDAVFGMTETWHVEIATGGRPRVFDLKVGVARGSLKGEIGLARVVDRDGTYRLPKHGLPSSTRGRALDMEGLSVNTCFALVFKSEPWRFPVAFDLKTDGKPATKITYLGASLARAETMPLIQNPGKAGCRSRVEPSGRPERPICAGLARREGVRGRGEREPGRADEARPACAGIHAVDRQHHGPAGCTQQPCTLQLTERLASGILLARYGAGTVAGSRLPKVRCVRSRRELNGKEADGDVC